MAITEVHVHTTPAEDFDADAPVEHRDALANATGADTDDHTTTRVRRIAAIGTVVGLVAFLVVGAALFLPHGGSGAQLVIPDFPTTTTRVAPSSTAPPSTDVVPVDPSDPNAAAQEFFAAVARSNARSNPFAAFIGIGGTVDVVPPADDGGWFFAPSNDAPASGPSSSDDGVTRPSRQPRPRPPATTQARPPATTRPPTTAPPATTRPPTTVPPTTAPPVTTAPPTTAPPTTAPPTTAPPTTAPPTTAPPVTAPPTTAPPTTAPPVGP